MAIEFTAAQKRVLEARGHNILVSAAAGSGKTAVLVERIVRLISEGDHPLDIDRLLVVTFTRAAAAQMRERIGQALAAKLRDDPRNGHLMRQEVLLHNAQITTIDSFCTFLLRNYFSEIDLDPGFRQIEETEADLLEAEVMEDFLEEKYLQQDPAFLRCAEYFSPGRDDRDLEKRIRDLCRHAGSHPSPEAWLRDRARDYDVPDAGALFAAPWMRSLVLRLTDLLLDSESRYRAMEDLCLQPGGPDPVRPFLEEERQSLFGGILEHVGKMDEKALEPDLPALWEEIRRALKGSFARYPTIRKKDQEHIDPVLRDRVKAMRDGEKKRIKGLQDRFGGQTVEMILAAMKLAAEPVRTLSGLAVEYRQRLQEVKRERRLIDFVDLEHLALDILAERQEDGSCLPSRTAQGLRNHFAEILIDEYQDSNEVQELLLKIISGEDEGRNNRFMVGDIKQSIYRFRLARPEIFMEKFDTYLPGDSVCERIDLDQNFRSREEVLDCVNVLFRRMMRREVGGVEYNGAVSLKKGASFPAITGAEDGKDAPYRAEFLLLETETDPAENEGAAGQDPEDPAASGSSDGSSASSDAASGAEEAEAVSLGAEISALTDRQREALMIAGRIREIVGSLPVRDEQTGQMRPARYGDIVILLRAARGWNEDLRAVFEREGIPAYAESRTGYFAAEEIRQVLALLRVLDNPRQDIPLYGALRGYFGHFTEREIARIRLEAPDGQLYDALLAAARTDSKASSMVEFLDRWRRRARYSSISEIVNGLLEETGYQEYCSALPAGTQRVANLRILRSQADSFTKTDHTGLFEFMRYIDGMNRQAIDLGEANILDENADVVRIMTIHKSKGLEFPICFVAGLSKAFSFRRFDAGGPVLYDSDWGMGVYSFDPVSRVSALTLRREEIAEKIRRDCMGEELRVLYVAMTRAKEKLILTASLKDAVDKIDAWRSSMAGSFYRGDDPCLSAGTISGASSYAELILKSAMACLGPDAGSVEGAVPEDPETAEGGEGVFGRGSVLFPDADSAGFPLSVRLFTGEDLRMRAAEEQIDLSRHEEILRSLEGQPLAVQPDPEAAGALARSVFFRYPHEELADLFAQTSVSELKHRAMDAWRAGQAGEAGEEGTAESAREMFPDSVPVPYVPAFMRSEEDGDGPGMGARRGTAFHRVLECLDYTILERLAAMDRDSVKDWVLSLADEGRLAREDAELVSPGQLLGFLRSDLAARMADASGQGVLFREQPFVMGLPADRVLSVGAKPGTGPEDGAASALQEEMVTVQGIIDAFFIEDGKIVLVDYKTDRVHTEEELAGRYRTQIELYAEALEKAVGLPVSEKILYSTALGRTVLVQDGSGGPCRAAGAGDLCAAPEFDQQQIH